MIALKAMISVITQPKAKRNTPLPKISKTIAFGTQETKPNDNRLNAAPHVKAVIAFFRYIDFPSTIEAIDCHRLLSFELALIS